MTTTNNILSAAQLMQARDAKHLELITISRSIVAAQSKIESHQNEIDKMKPVASYYGAVSGYHILQIGKQTEKRNALICWYEQAMWMLYSASLPIFSTTSVQEIAATLYSVHQIHA